MLPTPTYISPVRVQHGMTSKNSRFKRKRQRLKSERPLLFRSTAMAQTLSSRRHWRRELSVLRAQSATPATLSPAPCASLWPNRGHSGVMHSHGADADLAKTLVTRAQRPAGPIVYPGHPESHPLRLLLAQSSFETQYQCPPVPYEYMSALTPQLWMVDKWW
ncbi:hypothetical protein QTO34_006056 [Cnephaeus nilssonii]|uniref:Uncharacterized protein n=1 Tax=Cnephaeus nilssonii TaxID=3371016 RepID=A0AA40HLY1_CNENI|nr:hypothetical protein QTO34_006056 [Eptesicus nilssonii]